MNDWNGKPDKESHKSQRDLSCCGTDCSTCGCDEEMCPGCNACRGKVFHAPAGKACPIYECVVNEKGLEHCGQCPHLPCDIWKHTRDPIFTDKEFAENIAERVGRLQADAGK